MKHITSTTNPLIKHIVSLHCTSERIQHQQFIAEGKRTCQTLLDVGYVPVYFFVTEKISVECSTILPKNVIYVVTDAIMKKISASTKPSGMLGVFQIPQQNLVPLSVPGIVLYNIADPGNMGTLIRTAAALHIKTVVIIEGADCFGPKVIQATAGTIGNVHIHTLTWSALMQQKNNIPLCALIVEGGKDPQQLDLAQYLLVVGNEAHGLPTELQKQCDTLLTLPMPGKTDSLNVAIAGSIALYLTMCTKQ